MQISADGRAFTTLGTMPSQYQPAGASYAFQIPALAGTRYFRLQMLDADGTAAYSPVVTLAPAWPARCKCLPSPPNDN